MPRPPNGRVGRSAGVAKHRVARHRILIRLTRTTTFTRVSAIACVAALALAGAPNTVAAQTAGGISGNRAAVDATANAWFAAQRKAADLDVRIETLDSTLAKLKPRVDRLREDANRRAVALYESNTHALGVTDVMGDGESPIEVGRRATLIGHANANGQAVIDDLESSISDLDAQAKDLRDAGAEQEQTMSDLAARRRTLDSDLATLQAQAAASHQASAAATHAAATATTAEPTRSAPVALTDAPAPTVASTPAAPPATGQVSAHHNDPFLVCTRARESSGNYAVVSSAGYYGAYQFSPPPWNVTASHAGRLDLVGVLPSNASAYDQDEMAWTLYQWQGDVPWGGRC